MNKKAVSPLIATIFLIAVSVALGSIVMTLGQDYVSQAEPISQSCNLINYEIKKINYDSLKNYMEITIDNGDTAIDAFVIKLFDKEYSQGDSIKVEESLKPFDIKVLKLNVNPQKVSNVYEVKLLPQIKQDVCTASAKQVTANSAIFSKS